MANHNESKPRLRPLPFMRRLLADHKLPLPEVDWFQEIAQSLLSILNTHQGSAMIGLHFGLPDFNPESVSSQSLRCYELQMKTVICQYEPRFKEVEVQSYFDTEHKNHLIFHFSGVHEGTSRVQALKYESIMTEQGRLMIRGLT